MLGWNDGAWTEQRINKLCEATIPKAIYGLWHTPLKSMAAVLPRQRSHDMKTAVLALLTVPALFIFDVN